MGFLGTGWRFPIGAQADGDLPPGGPIAMASDADKIAQSIWIILTTSPGERVMRGDFGCGLNRLVFADLSQATLGQVKDSVQSALAAWEPRIQLMSVDVAVDDDQPNVLLIAIDYVVLATNSRFNLVYPFFLS
jgi:phage baseplate assembly protein W